MNTHDIELPPLPDSIFISDHQGDGEYFEAEDMQAYARAAIEAELNRQGDSAKVLAELVALIPLADTLNASASYQDLIDYFKGVIADRKRGGESSKCPECSDPDLSPEKHWQDGYDDGVAAALRRGEPVAFLYEIASTLMSDGTYSNWSPRLSFSMPNAPDGSIRNLRCLYAAPQPADPTVKESLSAAEPVKMPSDADIDAVWRELTGRSCIPGSTAHAFARALLARYRNSDIGQPTQPTASDESVTVPGDDALADALSNLEHDNYEQSYSGYKNRQADIALIRTTIEAHRKRGGEPVGYIAAGLLSLYMEKCREPGVDLHVENLPIANRPPNANDAGVVPIFLAPQPVDPVKICDCERGHNGMGMAGRECDCPAEPVKVPSDADIENPAATKLAGWLSAALEDPKVCQEMKDDILAWMQAGCPNARSSDGGVK